MGKSIIHSGSWILSCLTLLLVASLDQTTKDALKVQHVLKTIERHTPEDSSSAEVTEQELNAYIRYRIKKEENTLVRGLWVQLLGENRIRGDLRIDAEHLNLGIILGNDLAFDFKGRLVTATKPKLGGARYWMKCPTCDQRISKLYKPSSSTKFGCRKCHDLMYQSQEANVYDGWLKKTRQEISLLQMNS